MDFQNIRKRQDWSQARRDHYWQEHVNRHNARLHRIVMSNEEIERRYPRLIKAMQGVAILGVSEAVSGIRDIQFTHFDPGFRPLGCEAVAHFGGAKVVIQAAFRHRQRYRRYWDRRERQKYIDECEVRARRMAALDALPSGYAV